MCLLELWLTVWFEKLWSCSSCVVGLLLEVSFMLRSASLVLCIAYWFLAIKTDVSRLLECQRFAWLVSVRSANTSDVIYQQVSPHSSTYTSHWVLQSRTSWKCGSKLAWSKPCKEPIDLVETVSSVVPTFQKLFKTSRGWSWLVS